MIHDIAYNFMLSSPTFKNTPASYSDIDYYTVIKDKMQIK